LDKAVTENLVYKIFSGKREALKTDTEPSQVIRQPQILFIRTSQFSYTFKDINTILHWLYKNACQKTEISY
jgi:hypothetical protein